MRRYSCLIQWVPTGKTTKISIILVEAKDVPAAVTALKTKIKQELVTEQPVDIVSITCTHDPTK